MANYSTLISLLDATIYTNGVNAINAADENTLLGSFISKLGYGYQYAGVATPTTNPLNPDDRRFYIATQAGTYTNFNNIVVDVASLVILRGSGASWTADVLMEDLPTNESFSFTSEVVAGTELQVIHNKATFFSSAYYTDDNGYVQNLMIRNDSTLNICYVYTAMGVSNRVITLRR